VCRRTPSSPSRRAAPVSRRAVKATYSGVAGRPGARQLLCLEHVRERRRVEGGEQRAPQRSVAEHGNRDHHVGALGEVAGDQVGDDGHAAREDRGDGGRVRRRRQVGAGGSQGVEHLAALGIDDRDAEPAVLPLERAHGHATEAGQVTGVQQPGGGQHLEGADHVVEGVIDRRADRASRRPQATLGGVALAVRGQRQDDGREHEQGQHGDQHQRDEVGS